MDKTALIYEFNNESPLFAQVAASELENKNIDRALEILENGLQLFPKYATAYIIYAQALAMSGDFESADEMLKKGCNLIDSEDSYIFYSDKFAKLKAKSNNISESRRATFLPDNFDELSQEEINSMQEETMPEPAEEPTKELIEEETDELEILANELENAQMPLPEPEPESVEEEPEEELLMDDELFAEEFDNMEIEEFDPEDDSPEPVSEEPEEEQEEKEIVSETLAGIYFAQGSYEEALSIYEKLIIYQPDKSDFFKKRIDEIKKQL